MSDNKKMKSSSMSSSSSSLDESSLSDVSGGGLFGITLDVNQGLKDIIDVVAGRQTGESKTGSTREVNVKINRREEW